MGPSRLGKTDWARSHGTHIYMGTQFNLRDWNSEAAYLVLDDVAFKYIGGHRKGLWGAQKEVVISDKYMKKKTYKWGKPCIFVCNEDDDFRENSDLKRSEIEWYFANSVIVEVTQKMYITDGEYI